MLKQMSCPVELPHQGLLPSAIFFNMCQSVFNTILHIRSLYIYSIYTHSHTIINYSTKDDRLFE